MLVRRGAGLEILEATIDPEGRYMVLKACWEVLPITVVNSYAPNYTASAFFTEIAPKIAILSTPIVWVGDFNLPLVLAMDRDSRVDFGRSHDQATFHHMIEDLDLIDAWRSLHPSKREYSYISVRHRMSSRLDYVFISSFLRRHLLSCQMKLHLYSDHAMLQVVLAHPAGNKPNINWRLPPGFLTLEENTNELSHKMELFFQENKSEDTSHAIRWEACKATIRGWAIATQIRTRRREKSAFDSLTELIRQKEIEISGLLSQGLSHVSETQDLAARRGELSQVLRSSLAANAFHAKRLNFLEGEVNPKLLAWRLKSESALSTIRAISIPEGELCSDPNVINKIFYNHYSELYQAQDEKDQEVLNQYVSLAHLPRLDHEAIASLELPFTATELKTVIGSLASHKAPGPDGFPNELYKLTSDMVAQPLCEVFEEALTNVFFPASLTQANIVFLLKKDKNKLACDSYRPIALINTDVKIFARGVQTD